MMNNNLKMRIIYNFVDSTGYPVKIGTFRKIDKTMLKHLVSISQNHNYHISVEYI